ncbi:hypothetical protein Tco_0236678 [Tanacetum coccineum]
MTARPRTRVFRLGPVWGCDMASEQHGSGPELHGLTSEHISSGIVLNQVASTSAKPPTNNDWDLLFQPMFDEYFKPLSVVSTPISATTLLPSDTTRASSSSTSIDKDAPSPSTSPNIEATNSPINSANVEQNEEVAEFDSDTFTNPFAPPDTSLADSSSRITSLSTDALWCYFHAFLAKEEPKNYKEAMIESSWIEAMQEEIHLFDRLGEYGRCCRMQLFYVTLGGNSSSGTNKIWGSNRSDGCTYGDGVKISGCEIGGYTPGSDEGRLKLKELMAICTKLSKQVLDLEKEKDAQAVEILKLKQRVNKLERKRKSSISHPRRRIYMQVESSNDDLDEEDASKQGRESDKTKSMFQDSDFDVLNDDMEDVEGEIIHTATTGVSVVSAPVATAGVAIGTVEPKTPPTTVATTFIDENLTIAQTLIKMKEEKAKEKRVAIKDVEDSPRPIRSITTMQPLPTIDPKDKGKGVLVEEEPKKPVKVKKMGSMKLYEKEKKWIDDFKPIDDDSQQQAESTKKRPGADSKEESSKKQKLEEDNNAEKEELRDSMIVDGSFKNYKIFSKMLDDFDRQDVIDLHRLVNERYETTSPEGYDLLLCGDLKTLFEPNEEDEIWKNQQDYNLISWRLFNSCGVHILLMNTGVAIHMMIEKKYPLTQETLSRMLNRRLEDTKPYIKLRSSRSVHWDQHKVFKLMYTRFTKLIIDHFLSCNKNIPHRSNSDMHSKGQDLPLTKLTNTIKGTYIFRMEIPDTMIDDVFKKSAGYKYYRAKKVKATEEPEEQHVSLVKRGRGKGYMLLGSKASRLESLNQAKQEVAGEGSSGAHNKYYEFENISATDSKATQDSSMLELKINSTF